MLAMPQNLIWATTLWIHVHHGVVGRRELSGVSSVMASVRAHHGSQRTGHGLSRSPVAWRFADHEVNASALSEFLQWDEDFGWSAAHRPGVNYSDATQWPSLSVAAEDGWASGLRSPRTVVLSMPQRAARRHSFARQIRGIGWSLVADWAAAIDGGAMPSRLRWLTGKAPTKDMWDHDKPGNWGCYISHLAILRDHQAKCSDCDLLVFEDDAVFVPGFKERWRSFLAKVPQDWSIIRLGGQSLWEPSFAATSDYVRAKAVANTWGYIVRAEAVPRLADLLAGLPVKGQWGVDAVLQLFTEELKTYAPPVPLVHAVGSCSDSSAATPGRGCTDDDHGFEERIAQLHANWPQGYSRTYCKDRGVLLEGHEAEAKYSGCVSGDLSRETCCPYADPPKRAM